MKKVILIGLIYTAIVFFGSCTNEFDKESDLYEQATDKDPQPSPGDKDPDN
jgi:PBP1b-binding outer membrane lipoprotein LpoB